MEMKDMGSPVDSIEQEFPAEWLEVIKQSGLSESEISKNRGTVMNAIRFYIRHQAQKEKFIWPLCQSEGTSCDTLGKDDSSEDSTDGFKMYMSEREFIHKMSQLVSKENPNTKYSLGQIIGRGGTAVVHAAFDSARGSVVAVKEMDVRAMDRRDLVHEEIEMMRSLKHKNIVNYLECFLLDASKKLWIVLEYLDGGSLRSVVQHTALYEDQASVIIGRCLDALSFLHGRNVIHRDVKSDNVLLGMNGQVKLTDLGFCAKLQSDSDLRCSVVGTVYWMAPEVVREEKYNKKVDIWSLGIMLVEIIDGVPPYFGMSQVRTILNICSNRKPPVKEASRFSEDANQFLDLCLRPSQAERPTAEELLRYKFIRDYASCDLDISESIKFARSRQQDQTH